MDKHRTVQFVAILIFIAAGAYLVLGLIGASQIGRLGLGAGWSSGWRGWLTIPVLIGTLFGFATLMVFGAALFFLSKIDANLSLAKQRAAEAKKAAVHVAAPKVEVPHVTLPEVGAATLAAGAAWHEVLPPKIEVVTPEVEAPEVEVRAPEVTLPEVEIAAPEIEAAPPEVTAPAVHVEAPILEGKVPEVAFAAPAAAGATTDDLEALKAERAALHARIAELEDSQSATGQETRLAAPAIDLGAEDILSEPAAAQAEAGIGARLPGSEEIARIAAEMAAIKPVADAPQPLAAQSEPTPLARPDNVMLIDGIGMLYTQRLQKAGITTYKALAEASDEYLAQVTGATVERIQRENWRVQARQFGNLD